MAAFRVLCGSTGRRIRLGRAGVAKAIDILQKELSVAMALTGTTRVADIGPQVLVGGDAKKPARKRKG